MSSWSALKAPPVWHGEGDVLAINDHEIVIAPANQQRGRTRGKGLYIYNTFTNEWKKWIKYPKHFELHEHSIALNNHNQRIYFVGTMWLNNHWNQLMIAKASSEKVKNELEDIQGMVSDAILNDTAMSKIVNINGTMHIIGGWNNAKHFAYDENARRLRLIHDFADSDGFNELYEFSLVYVASKGLLFLIGGITNAGVNGGRIKYNKYIYVYDVFNNEWSKVKGIKFKMHEASAVLSYDEEYIIIAGGVRVSSRAEGFDRIYILDIRDGVNCKITQSLVRCPKPGFGRIARCGGNRKDNLLVFGYLRREFGSLNISKDMVRFIAMWYDQEMIHWIGIDGRHLCIGLRQILFS